MTVGRPIHTGVMTVFVALVAVALFGVVVVLIRYAMRQTERRRRAELERDQAQLERDQAKRRADQIQTTMTVVAQRQEERRPALRLVRDIVRGFAWLVGLSAGASAAARAAPTSGGAATATLTAKTAAIGFVAVAATAGGITYAVHIAHDQPERPSTNAIAAAPPRATQPKALPAPSAQAAAPAETPEGATSTSNATATPTTTPTTTTAPTPPRTPPASAPSGAVAAPATTTDATVATPAAPAPEVAATTATTAAPLDEAAKVPPGHDKPKGHGGPHPDAIPASPAATAAPATPADVIPAAAIPAETGNVHQAQHLLCVAVHRPLDVLDLCV